MYDQSGKMSFKLYLVLFVISAATLVLEIAHIKILSVMVWYHMAYMVISVALLGFGASGAFLSAFPSILDKQLHKVLTICFLGFSLSVLVAFSLTGRIPLDLRSTDLIGKGTWKLLFLLLYYVSFVIPYFFAGLSIAIILTCGIKKINKLYFVNLVGSGLGCLVTFSTITIFGAEKTVVLVAVAAAGAAVIINLHGGWRRQLIIAAFTSILAMLVPWAQQMITVPVARTKHLKRIAWLADDLRTEYSKWDIIGRVDVSSSNKW